MSLVRTSSAGIVDRIEHRFQLTALVARGSVVLAEYQPPGGRNFTQGTTPHISPHSLTRIPYHSDTNHLIKDTSQRQQTHLCLGPIPLSLHLRRRFRLPRHGRRRSRTVSPLHSHTDAPDRHCVQENAICVPHRTTTQGNVLSFYPPPPTAHPSPAFSSPNSPPPPRPP